MSKENYQQLQPLTVEQRVWVAIAALKFFQPMCYRENCQKIGKTPEENIIRPLDTLGFLKYLAVDGVLPDKMLDKPERYLQRINELLARLVFSGHLSHAGKSGTPLVGDSYYTLYQATGYERQGVLHLARALGPQFLQWAYRRGTYQITGVTPNGDVHAGTGIAIAPRWLMTCAHVLQDMKVDERQTVPAQGCDYRVVRQLPHGKVDVGLIEVDRDLPEVQGLNFRDPHVGERVYTFGFPRVPLSREATLVMQGGEVSVEQMTSLHGNELFLFSAIARPGNSGGPILSESGHAVGIVTQELSERDSQDHPFHAGIATATLAQAIHELDCGVSLPVETWQ